jgi:hypothetical protein
MEELQHRSRIEAQRDWGVVHAQQHALRVESIWTKFTTLDTRETLVYHLSLGLSTPKADRLVIPFIAGAGKSVLWYIIPLALRLDNLLW